MPATAITEQPSLAASELGPPLPLFRVGGTDSLTASPVVRLGGGLLLDSGEVDRTFVYRCQDRYLTLAAVLGWRPLFFVADDTHLALYRRELEAWRARYALVRDASGVLPAAGGTAPLFVVCDLHNLCVHPSAALIEALHDNEDVRSALLHGIYLNQISPTYADLLAKLRDVLAASGLAVAWDIEAARLAGALTLRFHDKHEYVELVRTVGTAGLPAHVPTVSAPPAACLAHRDWPALRGWYACLTGESGVDALFVKSSRDSGGNVAVRLTEDTFAAGMAAFRRDVAMFVEYEETGAAERLATLRDDVARSPVLGALNFDAGDLARFVALQAPRRSGIHLLVQREVRQSPRGRGGFAGIGLSYVVDDGGEVRLIAVGGQVYRDRDRRHFLGSYVGDDLAADARVCACAAATRALMGAFAACGYRGPISVDARLGQADAYELIYDANPRLTAIFPALAVRAMLRRAGLPAASVLSLGYRGEFDGRLLKTVLGQLDRDGLLYTRDHPAGAVVLPNLSRGGGVDLALVNVRIDEAAAVLAAVTSGSRLCRAGEPVPELYW